MNRKSSNKILFFFLSFLIFLSAVLAAFCTVYKTDPISFFKNYKSLTIEKDELYISEKGYLEVGGRLLQITSEEGLALSVNAENVVLYTLDENTKIVLYEDSGIKVGSLESAELTSKMQIEEPTKYFKFYEEKDSAIAEKIMINERACFVTYTHGLFEDKHIDTNKKTSGTYTEIYIFQDVGAKNYLSIRIADYSGKAPVDLIAQYTITTLELIA